MEIEEEGMRLRRQTLMRPIKTRSPPINGGDDEIKEDEDNQPLSPAGRIFHDPNFNVHVLAIMGIKTKIIDHEVTKANVKANLQRTLLKHPRFTSLQVVDEKDGKMKWAKTEVDLENHIIMPKINLTNDDNCKKNSDKFLEDYIFNLTKTQLEKSKPLWDFHILDLKTSEAEGVGIFRIHHSLGDGVSLMSLLLTCTRQTSNHEALPTLPTKKPTRRIETKLGLLGMVLKGLFWLWSIWRLFGNTLVDIFVFLASALHVVKDSRTPIKGPSGSENNPRRIVFRTVSLNDVKLVKNALKMTVNDIVLGITQAGLSKYLNRRYGLLLESENNDNETEKKNNIPKNIRMRLIMLVNIRPSAGIQTLADMMEKNTKGIKWGNLFGYVILPFTTGLKDDPLDYVHQAKALVDRKKHSFEALCSYYIGAFVYTFFGIQATSSLFRRLVSSTTLAFSNVVGPLEEVGFCGHPIAYIVATTYGQPSEVLVGIQSYVDKMSISLCVNESVVPDPHQLCEDIVDSLELLKDAVILKYGLTVARVG